MNEASFNVRNNNMIWWVLSSLLRPWNACYDICHPDLRLLYRWYDNNNAPFHVITWHKYFLLVCPDALRWYLSHWGGYHPHATPYLMWSVHSFWVTSWCLERSVANPHQNKHYLEFQMHTLKFPACFLTYLYTIPFLKQRRHYLTKVMPHLLYMSSLHISKNLQVIQQHLHCLLFWIVFFIQ